MKEKKEKVLDIYVEMYNTDRENAEWKLSEELFPYHEFDDEYQHFSDEDVYDLIIEGYNEAKEAGFGYEDFVHCYNSGMTFLEACADYDLI